MPERRSLEDIEETAVAGHPAFCDCCTCLGLEPRIHEDAGSELDEEWRDV